MTPIVVEGFKISTFDISSSQIDESLDFSFDGTTLIPAQISPDSFSYETTSQYFADKSDWQISFTISHLLEPLEPCFVKLTFPDDIDISQIDLDNIEGSNMLGDETGNKQILSTDKILVDDQ